MALASKKCNARRPRMAKAFEADTRWGSSETARMAGPESTAKVMAGPRPTPPQTRPQTRLVEPATAHQKPLLIRCRAQSLESCRAAVPGTGSVPIRQDHPQIPIVEVEKRAGAD